MKHFVQIDDYSKKELLEILNLAVQIKKNPKKYYSSLEGKGLGILFEKPSTRTRISFEVGMNQLGGYSLRLTPNEIQLGEREEIQDVARTLSRFLDVIALRTFSHKTLTDFAANATIPVINALTDVSHPCQAMADYLTIKEKFDDLSKIKFSYIGDGNNVLHPLMILLTKLGVNIQYATPEGFEPKAEIIEKAKKYAEKEGSQLKICESPQETVRDADVIYTDVFVSMGEEEKREEKLKAFDGFQVNQALVDTCEKKPLIMHCLPAHRGEEITNEIIESKNSIVFDQAENRLHAQKGILYYLLKS